MDYVISMRGLVDASLYARKSPPLSEKFGNEVGFFSWRLALRYYGIGGGGVFGNNWKFCMCHRNVFRCTGNFACASETCFADTGILHVP